ncbi:MAG TPA: hypothetical protein VF928_10460 [Usitatibacteraceae bacterium]
MFGKYYQPFSEGLIAHPEDCHGDVGPPTGMDIDVGNGQLAVSVGRRDIRQGVVSLRLVFNVAYDWVPDGSFYRRPQERAGKSTLSIRPAEFAAYGAEPTMPLKITPNEIREVNRGTGVNRPLPPEIQLRAVKSINQGDRWFVLYFEVELKGAKEFSVVVPPFTIDEIASSGRTIKFIEKNGWWIEPMNC